MMFANIAFSLLEINTRGIFHRDLKPDNMLFQTSEGIDYIVLTDFGTSKYSLSTEKYDTDQGLFSGTVQFNSPERFKGEMNKGKEDVWALGVTLYLLSSFALPFDAENKFNLAIINKITDPSLSH